MANIVQLVKVVRQLRSYEVHPFEFGHGRNRFKVEVDIKSIRLFRTNILIDISNLLSYTLAQLIWCSCSI